MLIKIHFKAFVSLCWLNLNYYIINSAQIVPCLAGLLYNLYIQALNLYKCSPSLGLINLALLEQHVFLVVFLRRHKSTVVNNQQIFFYFLNKLGKTKVCCLQVKMANYMTRYYARSWNVILCTTCHITLDCQFLEGKTLPYWG